jgi:hypothetical protein
MLLGLFIVSEWLYPLADRFDVHGRVCLDLERMAEAIRLKTIEVGALPDLSEVPSALVKARTDTEPAALDPNVIENGQYFDPWGAPYVYRPIGSDSFELRSYGRDREFGGEGFDADVVLRCLLLPVPALSRPSSRR